VRRSITVLLLAVFSLFGAACERVTGDSASRLVSAVREGVDRLKRSHSDTIVLSVAARSWPGGCPDGYRVEWRSDADRIPGLGVICTTGTRGYASIAYRSFVSVPRALHVTKQKGETATIALRKQPDGSIAVVALE